MKNVPTCCIKLPLIWNLVFVLLFNGISLNSQIVGGTDVAIGNYEAVGRLPGCSAALIGPKTVLTAAHCVCTGQTQPTGCRSRTFFTLTDVRPVDNPNTPINESLTRQDINIAGSIRVHPKYTFAKINDVFVADNWLSNDYAIVDLDQSVYDLALDVKPLAVEIPSKMPKLGDDLTIVGYGLTGADCDTLSGIKREITKPLWEISEGNVTLRIGRPQSGSCPGDSGGPAFNEQGKIVGVASSKPGNYDPTDLAYNFIKGFENLGGDHTASPAVVHTESGKIELFSRGTNHKLVQRSWNGTNWSGWINLEGQLGSSPTVVYTGDGKLEVFVQGKFNDDLIQRSWNGNSWSDWVNLGGDISSAPSVIHLGSGRLEVFARNENYKLVQKSWDGTIWSEWKELGGLLSSDPSAVHIGGDRIEVFARGVSSKLVQISYNGTEWSDWKILGGQLAASPSAVHVGSGRIELFMRGQHNDELVQRSWNGSKWSSWKNHSGNINSSAGLTYIDSSAFNNSPLKLDLKPNNANSSKGTLEVFVIDENQDLLYRSFPHSFTSKAQMGSVLIGN